MALAVLAPETNNKGESLDVGKTRCIMLFLCDSHGSCLFILLVYFCSSQLATVTSLFHFTLQHSVYQQPVYCDIFGLP